MLADDLFLEPERQQVSSSLQDTSKYSGRSLQSCVFFFGYGSTSNFQLFQPLPIFIIIIVIILKWFRILKKRYQALYWP